MPITLCLPTERELWLEYRKTGIGASEIGSVLGVDPWKSALDVYLEKTGLKAGTEEIEAMRWGTRLESPIAEEYAERTGLSVGSALPMMRHDAHAWMLATPDRMSVDGRLVQIKSVGHWRHKEFGDAGTDDVPPYILAQVNQEMEVTGAAMCDVVALFGGNKMQVFPVERSQLLIERIIESGYEFWGRVQRREPPEPDYESRNVMDTLQALYGGPDKTQCLSLGEPHWLELFAEWARLDAEASEREKRIEEIKARFKAALEGAALGVLSDGSSVEVKMINRRSFSVSASSFPKMRRIERKI